MTEPNKGRSTRDRILDALEQLLVEGGSRAATLDAVAAAAGVSKGGLLYHFASKDDLVTGMLQRLLTLAENDFAIMRTDERGPAHYYLETSFDTGSDFDRALIAAGRIAYDNDNHAAEIMDHIRRGWFAILRESLNDDALAQTIQLIGDGIYLNTTSGVPDPVDLDAVSAVLERLGVRRPATPAS